MNIVETFLGEKKTSQVTGLYYLIKELKCLPDILGRNYEVEVEETIENKFWRWLLPKKKIKVKLRQRPINIQALRLLFREMEEDYKKQNEQMKKANRRR